MPVVEPPAALKARIMAAAAADLEAAATAGASPIAGPGRRRRRPRAVGRAAPTPFPTPTERAARATAQDVARDWVLRIAAVLVIGVLGGWNLLLQGQLDAAQTLPAERRGGPRRRAASRAP